MEDEEQQVVEEVGETADETDVGPVVGVLTPVVPHEAETELLPPEVDDDEDEEVVPTEPDDFQGCVDDGHQPGPGPGPSPPGPFCSDILSYSLALRYYSYTTTLLTRLGSS